MTLARSWPANKNLLFAGELALLDLVRQGLVEAVVGGVDGSGDLAQRSTAQTARQQVFGGAAVRARLAPWLPVLGRDGVVVLVDAVHDARVLGKPETFEGGEVLRRVLVQVAGHVWF